MSSASLGSGIRRRMKDRNFARSRNTAAVISLFRSFMSITWVASIPVKTFQQHKYCDEPESL